MAAKGFPCIPNPKISQNLKKILAVVQYVIMSHTSLAVECLLDRASL